VTRQLTPRNLLVLRALADIERETGGFQPTVREIGSRTELSSTSTVQYHIDKLVDLGFVARRGARRAITTAGRKLING